MKKVSIILLLFPLLVLTGCGDKKNEENQKSSVNYSAERTSEITQDKEKNNSEKNNSTPKETTLSEFTTEILPKPANRITNIQISCKKLDGTIVENGQEFSFCGTVGQATSEEGYKEADVIINKKVVQALGGGMCQVSTTLYNAALAVPNIEIIERHGHDKPVPYIESGKDATVSYGSVDLKFKNNTGNRIKIYASSDDVNVTVKIVSLS